MATELWEIGLIVVGGFVGSFAPILLKLGMNTVHRHNLAQSFFNKYLIAGLFIYALSYIMSIPALKGGDLSILYPLLALSYIWVSIFSIFLLSEKMNRIKWLGIFLIIVGVSLIGLGV